jgi:cell division protease FtsH
MTREELEHRMLVLLGGRAAEHAVYGHLSTGAADDLSKATDIARSTVTRYGMGEALGPVTYEAEPDGFLGRVGGARRLYAEETAREIDVAVRDLVRSAFERARAILIANRPLLDEGARELLARETLGGETLAALLGRVKREERRAA